VTDNYGQWPPPGGPPAPPPGSYPQPGYPQPGYPQPGYPPVGYPPVGYPPVGYPQQFLAPAAKQRTGRYIAVAAVAAVAVIATGAVVGIVVSRPDRAPAAAIPTEAGPASGSAPGVVQITKADLESLATARSSALAGNDLDGFLARLETSNAKLIAGQRQLFANLRKLTFAVSQYSTLEQQGRASDRFGRAVTVDLDVAFVHQLKDYDAKPVAEWYRWTITKKDAASEPVITGITGAPAALSSYSKTVFYPAPWDKWPEMQTLRTAHTLFLVDRPALPLARRYAPVAEQAAVDALAGWRSGGQSGPVNERFVTSLVTSHQQLGTIFQIAPDKVWEAGHAMPMPEHRADSDRKPGAVRVVMDTSSNWFDGKPEHASEIFRHEYTHAMIEGINGYDNKDGFAGSSAWVQEGFADFVANRNVPDSSLSRGNAKQRVAGGQFDGKLPNDFAWDVPDAGVMNFHYYLAHSAYQYMARTYGVPKAYAFAATFYRGGGLANAFTTALGADQDTFQRKWAAFVRADVR
jgi:hypothetical protein